MKRLLLILTACAVAPTAQAAGQKITLKHKYTPGTYVVATTVKADNLTEMPGGMTVPSRMQMLMVTEMIVGQPDPKGQKIEVAYKRIRQSMSGGPLAIEYDSADPQGQYSPMAAGYKALLDTKITMTVAPDGSIVEVKGIEAMWEKLAETAPAAAAMMQGMKEQLSSEMFEQMVAAGAEFLPDKPVAKGEAWTVQRQQRLPMIGPTTMKHACTLQGIQDSPGGKLAVLAFTGTLAKDAAATQPADSPLPMRFEKVDIRHSGTMKMNLDLGMVTDMDIKQDMAMTMSMAGPGREGITMSVKSDGTTKTTIRPGKYVAPTTLPAPAPAKGPQGGDF